MFTGVIKNMSRVIYIPKSKEKTEIILCLKKINKTMANKTMVITNKTNLYILYIYSIYIYSIYYSLKVYLDMIFNIQIFMLFIIVYIFFFSFELGEKRDLDMFS